MEIENVFEVGAPPERVYAFLLDVEHIVGCVPGAELIETVDDNTFKGRVRIKVGPITVSYTGNAEITDRNAEAHTAVLKASGRETTGSGSARATATMSVNSKNGGSEVRLLTDFAVAGRVANFGRGVMEDVSRRLVGQMANCIKANLEGDQGQAPEQPPAPPPDQVEAAKRVPHPSEAPPAETPAAEALASEGQTAEVAPTTPPGPPADAARTGEPAHEAAIPPTAPAGGLSAPATTGEAVTGEPGSAQAAPTSQTPAAEAPAPATTGAQSSTPPASAAGSSPRPVRAEAKPINAFSLFFSILADRIRRLFGGGRT